MKKLSLIFLILFFSFDSSYAQFEKQHNTGSDVIFQLDSILGHTWNSTISSWTNSFRHQFTYDKEGNQIKYVIQAWDNTFKNWNLLEQFLQTFDANNYLIEQIWQRWDNNNHEWTNHYKTKITNNSAGSKIEEKTQAWDKIKKVWENESRDTYTYEVNGDTIAWINETWNEDSLDWEYYSRRTYSYGEDLLRTILYMLWDNEKAWQNSIKAEYNYDRMGNLTSEVWEVWVPDQEIWINYWRHKTIYDEYSNILEHISQDWNNNIWVNDYRSELHYLDNEFVFELIEQDWNSATLSWVNTFSKTWEYDIDQNPIDEYKFEWDDNNEMWNNLTWFHAYISKQNVEGIFESDFDDIKVYPNPFSSTVNIEYSLKKPQFHGISIYDIRGKEIHCEYQFKNQGNHQTIWDATGYAEGTYILKLKSLDEAIVKKLILKR